MIGIILKTRSEAQKRVAIKRQLRRMGYGHAITSDSTDDLSRLRRILRFAFQVQATEGPISPLTAYYLRRCAAALPAGRSTEP